MFYFMCIAHYLCGGTNKSLGIILIRYATFVLNFISFAASVAELAHGEKMDTQSPSLFNASGTKAKPLWTIAKYLKNLWHSL